MSSSYELSTSLETTHDKSDRCRSSSDTESSLAVWPSMPSFACMSANLEYLGLRAEVLYFGFLFFTFFSAGNGRSSSLLIECTGFKS